MKCKSSNTFRLVFAQLRDASSVATMLLVEPRAKTSSAQSSTSNTLSSAHASSYNRPQRFDEIATILEHSPPTLEATAYTARSATWYFGQVMAKCNQSQYATQVSLTASSLQSQHL